MDKLLVPEPGLIIWTIVTFLALVFLLKRFAWGPLLSVINEREARVRADKDAAQAARAAAEQIKADLEAQISGIRAKSHELMTQASAEGERLKAQMKAAAEGEIHRLKEKTMADLSAEKDRLASELRRHVADLSVLAAEKLLRRSVDEKVQKSVLDSFYKDLEGGKVGGRN